MGECDTHMELEAWISIFYVIEKTLNSTDGERMEQTQWISWTMERIAN